ncbi:MAG: restriction endonuclease subunit S [Oscillospiraceae bacterium]
MFTRLNPNFYIKIANKYHFHLFILDACDKIAWEQRKLGEILKVHPFKPYLAEPIDNGKYEVIQQGNDSVIGYADGTPFKDYEPTVLFGDHTVSLYKSQKPFFVATDGIKILSTIENFDGYFLYSVLEKYKPQSEGYKRHFSILKEQECFYTPNKAEQTQIGAYFRNLDNLITLHQRK